LDPGLLFLKVPDGKPFSACVPEKGQVQPLNLNAFQEGLDFWKTSLRCVHAVTGKVIQPVHIISLLLIGADNDDWNGVGVRVFNFKSGGNGGGYW
jgi:hypothetical protein